MNKEIYALEKYTSDGSPTIFLAGPTPRDHSSPSWRPNMINALRESGFNGDIFIPEKEGDYLSYEHSTQVHWEVKHLNLATLIVFWIPRSIPSMPGFTTNIEFGEFMHSGKILLGYPEEAEKMKYFKVRAEMHNIPIVHTIEGITQYIKKQFENQQT